MAGHRGGGVEPAADEAQAAAEGEDEQGVDGQRVLGVDGRERQGCQQDAQPRLQRPPEKGFLRDPRGQGDDRDPRHSGDPPVVVTCRLVETLGESRVQQLLQVLGPLAGGDEEAGDRQRGEELPGRRPDDPQPPERSAGRPAREEARSEQRQEQDRDLLRHNVDRLQLGRPADSGKGIVAGLVVGLDSDDEHHRHQGEQAERALRVQGNDACEALPDRPCQEGRSDRRGKDQDGGWKGRLRARKREE